MRKLSGVEMKTKQNAPTRYGLVPSHGLRFAKSTDEGTKAAARRAFRYFDHHMAPVDYDAVDATYKSHRRFAVCGNPGRQKFWRVFSRRKTLVPKGTLLGVLGGTNIFAFCETHPTNFNAIRLVHADSKLVHVFATRDIQPHTRLVIKCS